MAVFKIPDIMFDTPPATDEYATGTYVGTGGTPKVVALPFTPELVQIVSSTTNGGIYVDTGLNGQGKSQTPIGQIRTSNCVIAGAQITCTTGDTGQQDEINASGQTYTWHIWKS